MDHQLERTFLVPRPVRTEVSFLGMGRRQVLVVAPWAVAAALVYYLGGRLPAVAQMGIPTLLLLIGYLIFGWPGGEDNRTAWELIQRWRQHSGRQTRFLYRRECKARCAREPVPPRASKHLSGHSRTASASIYPGP